MNTTAITSRLTTGLVALVAGYASFTHIYSVAAEAGERQSVAAVLPLSIDGLILVGTLAMLDDKRSGRQPRLSARLAVAFGIVAALAAKIASAHPTWTARAVAAVPPVGARRRGAVSPGQAGRGPDGQPVSRSGSRRSSLSRPVIRLPPSRSSR
ncbi:DUF2637 domain-containing protein [Micromonospora sp. CB01531]|uniref:DUF2637 domain-containing protein n=1 Tax=Micromonospora sp. CB01531 TaxID=1718947 RepID=UPI00093EA618|nr:DUF2637 domain-containing protein [Micromonospora sp. CB01531]